MDFDDAPEVAKSGLYKIIYSGNYGSFGGKPYGLVVADYEIGAKREDLWTLSCCAEVARRSHIVFAAAAAPALFGVGSFDELGSAFPALKLAEGQRVAWDKLRNSADSQHVVLVAGRLRLREARSHTDLYPESGKGSDLWGSGALAVATRLQHSFELCGWGVHFCGRLSGFVDRTRAEVPWSDVQRDAFEKQGVLAVGCVNDAGELVLSKAPTLNAAVSGSPIGQLPNVLLATRMMQCSKVLHREQIGSWKKVEEVQENLNAWFNDYTVNAPPTEKWRPFLEARLEFEFAERKFGRRHFTLYLRPTWHQDERPWALRFEMVYDTE